jgi:hypothetical protein
MKRHIPLLGLTAVIAFSIGQFAEFPVARAATPTTDQLLSQIQALQTRVATMESATLATRTTTTTTDSKLAALQAKVDNMANVLQVTPGKVLLKSTGDISIEAGTKMLLKSFGDTAIEAGTKMSATAGTTYAVTAASTVNITGISTTTLSGSTVKLNGGSKPVSHQNGTSATVLVP